MLLSFLIIIPFFSGFFSFFAFKFKKNLPRWIALISIFLMFFITVYMWFQGEFYIFKQDHYPNWSYELILPWIPRFGIEFHIAIDGFSFLMLISTLILGVIAVLSSWNEIRTHQGLFYLNFLLVLSGVIGVFIAVDLFLFFFFWEMMVLPMYFLIALWGYQSQENKNCIFAANKFFIYTQVSGIIILSSILGLVFSYYTSTNILTFNYNTLLLQTLNLNVEHIIMLGFFLACAIKMPIVPFHGWLPDVHVQSPTCGAVEIIGILLKTAPYALLRYNLVLFPRSTETFIPIIMFLGLLSLFYGAFTAFSQTNIKRLIAYSSISHMGLILIGIYSGNEIAMQGSLIQILSNGISTSALCILSGQLYKRLHTQDMRQMGGLWKYIYWLPGCTLFFSLSNLGMPGTGNFTGEFLILFGLFQSSPFLSILSSTTIIFSSVYSLHMIHRIFYGSHIRNFKIFFLNKHEISIIIPLIFMLIFLGFNPQKVLDISYNSIHNIQKKFTDSTSKIRL